MEHVGIGLKWLLPRHKLLAAAQQIRESEQPNYAAIAYDFGYSSQQHFISAFKQVLGKTPLQHRKELSVPTRCAATEVLSKTRESKGRATSRRRRVQLLGTGALLRT